MPIFTKKELEHEIGQILFENGYLSDIEATEQYIDCCMSTITLKVVISFNGMVNPDEIKTESD
jgi:ribosomal protein S8